MSERASEPMTAHSGTTFHFSLLEARRCTPLSAALPFSTTFTSSLSSSSSPSLSSSALCPAVSPQVVADRARPSLLPLPLPLHLPFLSPSLLHSLLSHDPLYLSTGSACLSHLFPQRRFNSANLFLPHARHSFLSMAALDLPRLPSSPPTRPLPLPSTPSPASAAVAVVVVAVSSSPPSLVRRRKERCTFTLTHSTTRRSTRRCACGSCAGEEGRRAGAGAREGGRTRWPSCGTF